MFAAYLLAFCRMVIGMVFAWSLVGKARDMRAFEETITRFQVLPERWSRLFAGLVLIVELAVVGAMIAGDGWLMWGFLLGAGILIVFCFALVAVLVRGLHISCHCFGKSKYQISIYEIVRNLGIIFFAICGYSVITLNQGGFLSLHIWGWLLSGVFSVFFVLAWLQLRELAHLFC
ncbi:MAG: hypothetical protein Fur0022_43490 [Anaerolineales bacterium]